MRKGVKTVNRPAHEIYLDMKAHGILVSVWGANLI
uniref:Uncharacterized protein n=1 Tax=viral metagenome TaxID=1070528 RepID=A0A6C0DRG1_9ZZZZ